jgi:hypothetical protein
VFLLSLRAGSAGLTLTAATRVYLLEPALDPAVEQQAVARVHRIGQEKEVVITRLLVTDTVEEEVGICIHFVASGKQIRMNIGNAVFEASNIRGQYAGLVCRASTLSQC